MKNYKKQQGAVLLISIIFLLVITILGVTAVNSSNTKTQVAGNSMFSMLVYQGAESALEKSASNADLSAIEDTIAADPSPYMVPAAYLPDEKVASGGTLTSSSKMTFQGISSCPFSSGLATSTKFECVYLQIDAQSRLISTNARERHIKGIALTVKTK